jgi:acyl-CoA synthetase (AMP-forming)/AMP-acid ligase II
VIVIEDPWSPPAETIPGSIAWWAEQTPEAPALLGLAGERLSFGELQTALTCVGRDLAALGIGRGDRVVLALPDGVAHAVAMLGTIGAAVAVPVNPVQAPVEAEQILTVVQPRAVIEALGVETDFRGAARAGVPVFTVDRSGALLPDQEPLGPPLPSAPEPAAADLAMILLTSGTTDRPRRVPVSHGMLLDTCAARVAIRGFTARDRCLNAAPGYFVLGISRTAEALICGGSAIVAAPSDVVLAPEAVRDLQPTWAWLSPALLGSILQAAAHNPAFAQWPLRLVRLGGSRVASDLAARGEALWGLPMLNGYGTTETLGFISAEEYPETVPRKPGSLGLARPGQEIVICADDGTPLPAGTVGEITVQTRGRFDGYLDDPAATAAVFFPGGWYRTGDLGYLDEDGYLFVTGRMREMINRGGEKIAPHEIDEVLRTHPAIAEAAAFALPDRRLGEEVAAAVVARDGAGLTERGLRRWAAARLSPHKVPRRIWFVAALPHTGSGKVQRTLLTEQYRKRANG